MKMLDQIRLVNELISKETISAHESLVLLLLRLWESNYFEEVYLYGQGSAPLFQVGCYSQFLREVTMEELMHGKFRMLSSSKGNYHVVFPANVIFTDDLKLSLQMTLDLLPSENIIPRPTQKHTTLRVYNALVSTDGKVQGRGARFDLFDYGGGLKLKQILGDNLEASSFTATTKWGIFDLQLRKYIARGVQDFVRFFRMGHMVSVDIYLLDRIMSHQLSLSQSLVVAMFVFGLPAKEVAEKLHLSQNTVDSHIKKIYYNHGIESKNGLFKFLLAQ